MAVPEVQHGRRKGLSRACSAGNPLEDDQSGGLLISNGIDVRQMTVLPRGEWERIQNNLNTLDKEAMRICAERKEKEAMHLQSKEIVKHWTNTIAGQRQKKLKAKIQREEKEEEEKKQIDLQEAEYQAEKRREAIENAKTKLYYQNDKVKTFHGALLLTEVMKEREAQMELKNKMANYRKKQDDVQMQHQMEEDAIKDQQRAYQQFMERKKNADDLQKQIEEHKHEIELLKAQDKKEGAEIQRLTRLHEFEMHKLNEMKKKAKQENMKNYVSYVADRDFLREMEKQKQEAQEEQIRLFILAKKKMSKIKHEKEMELEREIQKHRNHISKLLSEQLKQQIDDEDARIANAVAELEEKAKQECREKDEKIKADLKAIADHRIAMRKKKEAAAKEEKLNALQSLYAIKEADQMCILHNKEKIKRAEEESRKIQAVHIQQMAERRCKSMNEKEADLEYDKQNEDFLTLEEKDFQEYAKQVIDSVSKAGRDPYPLLKAAQAGFGGGRGPVHAGRGGIRPSYLVKDISGVELPSYQNSTTQQIKEIYDTCDINRSKKKLGFTW